MLVEPASSLSTAVVIASAVAAAAACGARDTDREGLRPGGSATVGITPTPSAMRPAASLPRDARPNFHAGKALAHQPWVTGPTITDARDGLGPLYNARTCLACHINGGRGPLPERAEQPLFAGVLRLSIPGKDRALGVVPEPTYGDQLQTQSTALAHQLRASGQDIALAKGEVAPEATIRVRWHASEFRYPDGTAVALRRPEALVSDLGYGPLHPEVLTSLRAAPTIHGAGLLDLIPAADIEGAADPDDDDGDGVSGRPNVAWDFERQAPALGRFGWKANRASLRTQVAAALQADLGIANPVFPEQPCTDAQRACARSVHGTDEDGFEISAKLLTLITNFNRDIGVPQRRKPDHPMVLRGQRLFRAVRCDACHTPSHRTGDDPAAPHLSGQQIWPYTDLLLHDLGEGLADGRPDYLATGAEWRTAPLWGVGLRKAVNGATGLLHDGRARTVEEAVLWHGGEARGARDRFAHLDPDDRAALIAFVRSL